MSTISYDAAPAMIRVCYIWHDTILLKYIDFGYGKAGLKK